MLWEPKLLCVDTEIHPVTIFYSVSKLQLDGCLFFYLQHLALGVSCLSPTLSCLRSAWPSSGACPVLKLTFILVAVPMSPPPSKKSWVLRLQKKTWIFQYCTRRRPLDQVFAKVCKSLNEVACLTFSSLILFHAKIPPVNIDSREEMWKNLNRRRISFLQGSCDAWSLADCGRHMNNFCISASLSIPHTQTYHAYFQNVKLLSCRRITLT